jgi:ubiquinone/menaquinone biosynthesis C-methylase UbiE
MGLISPGNFDLIAEAVDICGFPEGARVLDAGCGEGDTLAFLERTYGINGVGIDRSEELLRRGREKYPRLDLRRGEMETPDFPSSEFDGAIMECVLSLSDSRLESLREVRRLLKKGGKLIIADLYVIDPDPEAVARARKDSLAEAFDEQGFELLLRRDKTELLRSFVAEKIFEYGSLAAFWRAALPPGAQESDFCRVPVSAKNIGYFLAVLMK